MGGMGEQDQIACNFLCWLSQGFHVSQFCQAALITHIRMASTVANYVKREYLDVFQFNRDSAGNKGQVGNNL